MEVSSKYLREAKYITIKFRALGDQTGHVPVQSENSTWILQVLIQCCVFIQHMWSLTKTSQKL